MHHELFLEALAKKESERKDMRKMTRKRVVNINPHSVLEQGCNKQKYLLKKKKKII